MLDRLGRLDSCALSDALDSLGQPGVVAGLRRWGPARRLAGRVITVELGTGPGPASGSHLGTAALSVAGPGDVIVVANAGRTEAGSWGGLLTLEAQLRGVSGVVVDGALRDADEVRELGVPVFARAATPRTARGRYHEVSTGERVLVEGVSVEPGAFVLADGSGVVFVARPDAERVLGLAEDIAERESRMAEALVGGGRAADVMDARYERMLDGEVQ